MPFSPPSPGVTSAGLRGATGDKMAHALAGLSQGLVEATQTYKHDVRRKGDDLVRRLLPAALAAAASSSLLRPPPRGALWRWGGGAGERGHRLAACLCSCFLFGRGATRRRLGWKEQELHHPSCLSLCLLPPTPSSSLQEVRVMWTPPHANTFQLLVLLLPPAADAQAATSGMLGMLVANVAALEAAYAQLQRQAGQFEREARDSLKLVNAYVKKAGEREREDSRKMAVLLNSKKKKARELQAEVDRLKGLDGRGGGRGVDVGMAPMEVEGAGVHGQGGVKEEEGSATDKNEEEDEGEEEEEEADGYETPGGRW